MLTEAKEGPLELRRKAKITSLGEGEGKGWVCSRETERMQECRCARGPLSERLLSVFQR